MRDKEQYDFWLSSDYFNEETKAELIKIKEDEKEIEDRFYRELEFGTGGLRGIIGAGTNRMNIYTVRKATQGLANYILMQGGAQKGVVIAYDSRHFSAEFAEEAALCLAANGIRAYVFTSLHSTPELSFAVRFWGCIAGINITASHNPPEYNGYKVYWEDGAQITAPLDNEIIAQVNRITDYTFVKTMSKEAAMASGLYRTVGSETDDAYMEAVKQQQLHPEVVRRVCKDLKIVYSPFNGTGNVPVCRLLRELGFEQVYVVEEQQLPDPEFTTLGYPNPENPQSFELALQLAQKVDADIVLATDPDADRLGIYVKALKKDGSADYIPLNGNMSGALICEYILRERTALGSMPKNPAVVSTIVTTDMVKKIAERYGVHFVEVLTGFKYIGEKITEFEKNGTYQFVFGMEESYGCLAGTHARDKDAIVAVLCLCEVAAWCKNREITLWEYLLELYETYGYYREDQYTMTLKGIEGSKKIVAMMECLRHNPPKELGGYRLLAVRDYKDGLAGLPKSNVLYFELEEGAWCCVRPSGTEPKIKFYMGVKEACMEQAKERLRALKDAVKKLSAVC